MILIVTIPIAVLISFIPFRAIGITANKPSMYGVWKWNFEVKKIIAGGQTLEAVRVSSRKLKITYTVVLDQDVKVSRKYGVTGLPQTIFLDRSGVIRCKLFGEAIEDMLEQLILKLL